MMKNAIKTALVIALLLAVVSAASAKVYMFDFGDAKSPVQQGYVQITPKSAFPAAEAGWAQAGKLEAKDKAYTEYQDTYRGKQPPPVWTTTLSEDCIVSAEPGEFAAKVEPGKYQAWVLCGTSASYRAQLFSFDVTSGAATTPVQFENSYQYRDITIPVDATGGEARIKFVPRSLFAVAGIVLFQDADAEKVKTEIIRAEREPIDFLPAQEAAKWSLVPRVVDNSPWPQVSDSDQKRGYLVHTRHWAEDVYPYTVPIAQEINPTLRAFATPGEYEPLNFLVYPFKSFQGCSLKVSDLKAGTNTIPAKAVELRRIKYMRARDNYTVLGSYHWVPDPLMPFDASEPLVEKENARFWMTVHVPATAKPGTYKGTITFTPQGSTPANIPVVFRVLPIKLQEDPSKIYGIYYYDPMDDWFRATDETSKAYFLQKSDYELADLVAHGTRNVVTGLYGTPDKANPGKFTFNFDLMQTKIDRWRKAGFVGPVVVQVNAGTIYTNLTKQDLGSHIASAEPPPAEYSTQLTELCKEIEAERVKRGWPQFLYYPIDEPGTSAGAIAFMTATLKAVRAAGVKTYVTADPTNEGFAPLKPYIDVWCTQPFLPSRDEILKDKAARPNVDYWCYPNHVNGENDHTTVNGARMTYGFGFWRSGFTTLIPWIYRSNNGNPWNYLDGTSSDFFNRTEDSGRPIPVQMWEGYREGYDDYRYIYTLQTLIARAKKQGGRPARAAADAQKDLEYCWNQIRVQPKYKWDNLWEPREGDVYRWVVANAILDLQEAGAK
ncbi:MAG: hypothetical protein ACM3VW_09890 [Bacteroidota bacterium]